MAALAVGFLHKPPSSKLSQASKSALINELNQKWKDRIAMVCDEGG